MIGDTLEVYSVTMDSKADSTLMIGLDVHCRGKNLPLCNTSSCCMQSIPNEQHLACLEVLRALPNNHSTDQRKS